MPVLTPEAAHPLDRLDRCWTALHSTSGPGLNVGNYMGIGRKKAQWTAWTGEKATSPSGGSKLGRLSGDTAGEDGSKFTAPYTRGIGGPGGPGGPGAPNDQGSLKNRLDRRLDRFAIEAVQATNQQANQQEAWESLPAPVQEVLGLPVRQLCELPIPSTLSLRLPTLNRPVVVTASLRRYRTLVADGVCTFAPGELVLLTAALEAGRATPAEVVGWCRRKLEIPGGWKLGVDALGLPAGATVESLGLPTGTGSGEYRAHGWTLGRVLQELGGRVVAVELELPDQTTETLWAEGRT